MQALGISSFNTIPKQRACVKLPSPAFSGNSRCTDLCGSERRRPCTQLRAETWDDKVVGAIDGVMGDRGSSTLAKSPSAPDRKSLGNGVLILLALNFAIYAVDHMTKVTWISKYMYLHVGKQFHWWQLITSAFCHSNFQHLSNNMFMLYVFGKSVEEDEGTGAVLISYIICALGSSVAFWMMMKNSTLLGASGACFGLFIVSAAVKLQFDLRKLVELAAIGPFVWSQVSTNVVAQMAGSTSGISYLAHLGGGAAGLVLVLALALLPAE